MTDPFMMLKMPPPSTNSRRRFCFEYKRFDGDAGWSSPVARQAHNLKVAGSNPAPATNWKNSAVSAIRTGCHRGSQKFFAPTIFLNAKMAELADIKVVLQNPDGKYLAGSAINWWFTEDRFGAIVFDFWGQQVKEQL